MIDLWISLQNNNLYLPKDFSIDLYNDLKNTLSPNPLKAVAEFGFSFGGKYFGGYCQKYVGNSKRNYYSEFENSLDKIKPHLNGFLILP